jgi:DNA repair ATPase RecN
MSTPHRIKINRANSQHSTGPKTPEGKKQSSLNALRHGLTGQIVVMPTEDLEAYRSHLKSFEDEYAPQGATEANLVQALADTSWRLNRVASLETNLLTLGVTHRSPIPDAPQQVQDAMSIVAALESQSKALSNLSLHSQRLSRQFERTAAQLRDLQKTRIAQEKRQLDGLLDIIEMHKSKGEIYAPSNDGFVFSKQQISAAMCTRKRQNLAHAAHNYRLSAAA